MHTKIKYEILSIHLHISIFTVISNSQLGRAFLLCTQIAPGRQFALALTTAICTVSFQQFSNL